MTGRISQFDLLPMGMTNGIGTQAAATARPDRRRSDGRSRERSGSGTLHSLRGRGRSLSSPGRFAVGGELSAGSAAAVGRKLAELLAADCKLAQTYPKEVDNLGNLARIATFYEMQRSRNELVTAVQDAVGRATKPSAAVRALAELDFPLVLTTNYDQLLERALNKADKNPRKGVYDPEGLEATTDFPDGADDPQRPFIFKIHGDVDAPKSVVITDEDYIQFTLRMGDRDALHPVPETFRYQFKRMPTLFIGYSLVDYNLRLLFKTLRWKLDPAQRKPAYSVDLYPDPCSSSNSSDAIATCNSSCRISGRLSPSFIGR